MIKTAIGHVNLKSYGAIGDGTVHTVAEWLIGGNYDRGYANLAAIQADYPSVTALTDNADLAAWNRAKNAVPASGGTLFIPNGTYIGDQAENAGFFVLRDNIDILGESKKGTVLEILSGSTTALQMSVYRRGGWDMTQLGMKPFVNTMNIGQGYITMKDAADASHFEAGDKVFINGGSSIQFDQEYGEFNVVKSVSGSLVYLTYPLLRDYSTLRCPFAGELLADFTAPAVDANVNINIDFDNTSLPPNNLFISIGNDLYQIISSSGDPSNATVTVKNCKSTNASGTIVSGTKIFKGRAIFKTPQSSMNVSVSNLTLKANADCLGISNSIKTRFRNVETYRNAGAGLWLDGDDGRDAYFVDCNFTAETPTNAQPARSFAEMRFFNCEFNQCGIHFSEFVNNSEIAYSRFYMHRDTADTYADIIPISIGWTTGNIRVKSNNIYVESMTSAIDTFPDINGWRAAWRGGIEIKDNYIHANDCGTMIRCEQVGATEISGNKMFGSVESIFAISGHVLPETGDGTLNNAGRYIGVSYLDVHHNQFSGDCNILNYGRPVNIKFTDNYIHQINEVAGNGKLNGNIMWSSSVVSQPTEMVIFENNIFKNWRLYDNSFNYEGELNGNVKILNNRFIDAHADGDQTGNLVIDTYPLP